MKLIGTPTSPYTRKARVVLAEKRIDYEFVVDPPYEAATEVPAYNPLGKVPVLVLDDDTTIFDSRVIVEYLDNASPVTKLLPEDTRQRIQARRWEALADGCTDAIVAIVMEKRRPPELPVRRHGSRASRARSSARCRRCPKTSAQRSWCCGDFFNLSDIAVGCCLGFLDLRLPDVAWRETYPNLAKLADKLAQRPSFRDTRSAARRERSRRSARAPGAAGDGAGGHAGGARDARFLDALASMMPPPRHTRLS